VLQAMAADPDEEIRQLVAQRLQPPSPPLNSLGEHHG